MSTRDRVVSAKTNRRGRPTITPTTQLGVFLQKRLDELGLTRRVLAKRLGVSSSTIGDYSMEIPE